VSSNKIFHCTAAGDLVALAPDPFDPLGNDGECYCYEQQDNIQSREVDAIYAED